MKKQKMKYRIKNKKRLVLSLTLVMFILMSCFLGTVTGKEQTKEKTYIEYTVTYGDTLWNIAERHNFSGADVREVIYNIKTANALEGSDIEHGRTLLIPVETY